MKFVVVALHGRSRDLSPMKGEYPRLGLDFGDRSDADGTRGRRLAHDHLARGDEATGEEKDNVLAAANAGLALELLPVELVADHQIAAATPLEIPLLKTVVRADHLGVAVQGS